MRCQSRERWAVSLLVGCALACGLRDTSIVRETGESKSRSREEQVDRRPKRALTSPGWETAVIWASHILVRHRASSWHSPPLTAAQWDVSQPPQRSREEARALAEEIAASAKSNAASFAELADEYSDDLSTRGRHGHLGGIPGGQLALWPQVMDALMPMAPGSVSEVVETQYGFHIFQRLAPPPEGRISGARIVIGHDEAPWLKNFRGRRDIERGRAAAQVLARELSEYLTHHPEEFPAMVERYSDHIDAAAGGDIGEWSTREGSALHREIEALTTLQPGEVSPPIDTLLGFQILQRTPERRRETYAVDAIRIAFDRRAPASKQEALTQSREIIEALGEEPSLFSDFQKRYCCRRTEQWVEGRNHPDLSRAVAQLSIGAISPTPIEIDQTYVVFERIAPKP